VPDSAECCCATPQTQVCLRVGLCSQPCEQPEGRGRGRLAGGRAYQHAQQHQLEHWVGGTHGPVTAAPSLLRVESTRLISFVSRRRLDCPCSTMSGKKKMSSKNNVEDATMSPNERILKNITELYESGTSAGGNASSNPPRCNPTRHSHGQAHTRHAAAHRRRCSRNPEIAPFARRRADGWMADGRGRVDGAEGRLRRPARQLALPLPSQARTFPATFPNPIDLSTVLRKRPRR
jgi:hypothetical protein